MSKRIAFGGIMTAVTVLLIYLAAYLPTGRLGMYAISSLVIASAVIELGIKWGTVVYGASAMLIFLLSGSINAFLVFAVFFGSYPLLKYYIEKNRGILAEIGLKLLAANALGVLGYFLYKTLLGVAPVILPDITGWLLAILVLAIQPLFLMYDYILSRLIVYYLDKIKIIRP